MVSSCLEDAGCELCRPLAQLSCLKFMPSHAVFHSSPRLVLTIVMARGSPIAGTSCQLEFAVVSEPKLDRLVTVGALVPANGRMRRSPKQWTRS